MIWVAISDDLDTFNKLPKEIFCLDDQTICVKQMNYTAKQFICSWWSSWHPPSIQLLISNVLFSPTSYWMDHLQVFHFITVPPLKEKIEPRTANWTECICPKTWFRGQKPGKVSKTLDHVSRSPKAYPITNPATPGKPSSSQSLRMHIFHTVFQAFSMVLSVLPYFTHDR